MLVEEENSNSFVNSFQVLVGAVGRVPISPASPASLAPAPRSPLPAILNLAQDAGMQPYSPQRWGDTASRGK